MTSDRRLDGSCNPPPLGDILRINAHAHPERVAISYQGSDISFAQLLERSLKVANALRSSSVGVGDRIAILSKNAPEFFEILFGAAIAGVVPVPINWRLSAREVAYLLADSGTKVLFAGVEHRDLALEAVTSNPVAPVIIALEGVERDGFAAWRDKASARDDFPAVDAKAVALQLYTSGTTGRPKGALLSHHSLNSVRVSQPESAGWSQWTEEDCCLISMPLFHVGGIGTALASIYHAARMVIARDFTPEALFDYVEHEGITKLFLVPAAMRIVLDHPRARLTDYSRIHYILYGSSPITPALLREAIALFNCGFVQVYGMTETSGTIVVLPPEDHVRGEAHRMRSAGKPLAGVEIAILDADGRHLPPGEVGEIAIRSQANMTGYWNQPAASAECLLADGFLRSGDAGYLDQDGYVFVCDRVKDMIISGGENVYAAEVEAALCEHPDVAEVAVVGIPDARWGEAVKAFVVAAPGVQLDPEALRAFVRERLAAYKVPKTIAFVNALPKNAAGKVLRRALRPEPGALPV